MGKPKRRTSETDRNPRGESSKRSGDERRKADDRRSAAESQAGDERSPVGLRIIGGKHRGRILKYSGDMRTRPMKDRVREAVFNLVGPRVEGTHAIDLFAGTGALGLEAISRGAEGATFIERHLPTAKLIEQNSEVIGARDRINVIFGDAFRWAKSPTAPTDRRWTVFCSPPYDFYVSRKEEMLELITRLLEKAPIGSVVVVESDKQFDMSLLPGGEIWDVREYLPAIVAIARTGSES